MKEFSKVLYLKRTNPTLRQPQWTLVGTIIHLVIAGIIGGIFVWLAAKALGAPRASYWHGILTVVWAIILTDIIGYFIGGLGMDYDNNRDRHNPTVDQALLRCWLD